MFPNIGAIPDQNHQHLHPLCVRGGGRRSSLMPPTGLSISLLLAWGFFGIIVLFAFFESRSRTRVVRRVKTQVHNGTIRR